MSTLSYEDTYRLARQAGFSPAQSVIATAIAMAESGFSTTARGDTTITSSTWGPSVGLWQVRSFQPSVLATASGSDSYRDATRLTDPQFNAAAAFAISGKGKTWLPWSVYSSGSYAQYLAPAQAAGARVEGGGGTSPNGTALPILDANGNPANPANPVFQNVGLGDLGGKLPGPLGDVLGGAGGKVDDAASAAQRAAEYIASAPARWVEEHIVEPGWIKLRNGATYGAFVVLGVGLVWAGAASLAKSGARSVAGKTGLMPAA